MLLTVRIGIQITSGTALNLRLETSGDPGLYGPLWTTTPRLVPDSRGLATVVLHYRVAAGANACADGGQSIPGLTAVAHVAAPGGVKTVRFQEFLDPLPDPTCSR